MSTRLQNENINGNIPVWKKLNLTVNEASVYSGIGINKIRELMKEPDCNFVLKVGINKSLIKRRKFEEYINSKYAL